MDFQKRIDEVGKKPSKKVEKIYDDFQTANDVIFDLQKNIEELQGHSDVSQIQAELDEMISERDVLANQLDKAIEQWKVGLVKIENMKKKKEATPAQVANGGHISMPAAAVVERSGAVAAPIVESVVAEEVKEKKSGYGWLIFGGIGLILTLGAVNLMKNK